MKKKVIKIGGSLYTAIPPYIIEKTNLKEGDLVDVDVKKDKILITKMEGK